MKALQMDPDHWEALAADRPKWRNSLMEHLKTGEMNLTKAAMVRFVFIQKINPLPHDMGIRIKSAIKSYIYMWHEKLNNEKLK